MGKTIDFVRKVSKQETKRLNALGLNGNRENIYTITNLFLPMYTIASNPMTLGIKIMKSEDENGVFYHPVLTMDDLRYILCIGGEEAIDSLMGTTFSNYPFVTADDSIEEMLRTAKIGYSDEIDAYVEYTIKPFLNSLVIKIGDEYELAWAVKPESGIYTIIDKTDKHVNDNVLIRLKGAEFSGPNINLDRFSSMEQIRTAHDIFVAYLNTDVEVGDKAKLMLTDGANIMIDMLSKSYPVPVIYEQNVNDVIIHNNRNTNEDLYDGDSEQKKKTLEFLDNMIKDLHDGKLDDALEKAESMKDE